MNYGDILIRTWKTIWKDKVILGFGFLMMLAPALLGVLIGGAMTFGSLNQLERFIESDFSVLATLLFFFAYFIFIALTIIMSAVSFSGTLKGTLMAQDANAAPLNFNTLWAASLPYLWRMLGVMFTVGFALGVVYLVPMLLLFAIGALTAGIGFLCAIPFILLMIPVGLVGYLLLSLSMAALVADDSGVLEAVQAAWATLKAKFWQLVLMTVILYMIQFGVGMVIAIPMNILQFALIIPLETMGEDAIFRAMGIMMAIFIPLSTIVQSLGLTYVNGAWMLTYLEASKKATDSEIDSNDEIIEYDA